MSQATRCLHHHPIARALVVVLPTLVVTAGCGAAETGPQGFRVVEPNVPPRVRFVTRPAPSTVYAAFPRCSAVVTFSGVPGLFTTAEARGLASMITEESSITWEIDALRLVWPRGEEEAACMCKSVPISNIARWQGAELRELTLTYARKAFEFDAPAEPGVAYRMLGIVSLPEFDTRCVVVVNTAHIGEPLKHHFRFLRSLRHFEGAAQ